jgi:hypothetical protein
METKSSKHQATISESKQAAPSRKKPFLFLVIATVFVGVVVVAVLEYREIIKLRDPEAQSEVIKKEALELKNKVGRLIQLPDEEPTIATVKEADKLKQQDFFKDALEGDKVLIFTEAKRAVIYRPGEHKIINSGPIVLASESAGSSDGADSSAAAPSSD